MSEREERRVHHLGEGKPLSDAVLEAIAQYHGTDLRDGDFRLYDDIDVSALDDLFREDANADTTVQFKTGDVTITLWGDGDVRIRVTPRRDAP
ncbi:HalOD1 output domain-containing protein [Halobium palmae]|uniref:HalOD1 output domain-containing protein n=1 Tax=Halobium palmae TaxID=1776492 RepID=A0ABD5S5B1_9EURY